MSVKWIKNSAIQAQAAQAVADKYAAALQEASDSIEKVHEDSFDEFVAWVSDAESLTIDPALKAAGVTEDDTIESAVKKASAIGGTIDFSVKPIENVAGPAEPLISDALSASLGKQIIKGIESNQVGPDPKDLKIDYAKMAKQIEALEEWGNTKHLKTDPWAPESWSIGPDARYRIMKFTYSPGEIAYLRWRRLFQCKDCKGKGYMIKYITGGEDLGNGAKTSIVYEMSHTCGSHVFGALCQDLEDLYIEQPIYHGSANTVAWIGQSHASGTCAEVDLG